MHPVAKPTHLPSTNSASEIQVPSAPLAVQPGAEAAMTEFSPDAASLA
jgi:hypothetical protein